LRCHKTWLLCLHEKHANQSIPMLCCKGLSFWSKTQAMFPMSEDMENSSQKAGTSSGQDSPGFDRAHLPSTAKSSQREPGLSSDGPGIELPIPKSASAIRPERKHTKISSWSSDVSFSPDLSIPIASRTLETSYFTPENSRINLPTGSSSFRTSRGHATLPCSETPRDALSSSTHSAFAYADAGISQKRWSLSKLSNLSRVGASYYDKHHRIDEPINPRSYAPNRKPTNSQIAPALDNRFYKDEG